MSSSRKLTVAARGLILACITCVHAQDGFRIFNGTASGGAEGPSGTVAHDTDLNHQTHVASHSFQPPKVMEPQIPGRSVSVLQFGAVPDGQTLNTTAISNAIAALEAKGGGRVMIPAGLWLTGPIGLRSRIELHLEEGALLRFSTDHSLYPPRSIDFKGRTRVLTTSPIHGEGLEDIAITGRGVIDGQGGAWRPVKRSKMTERRWNELVAAPGSVVNDAGDMWWPSAEAREDRRPNLLKLVNCRRILLDEVTFQNSPGWNLNPTLCDSLTLRNITVRNPWFSQNGDGLDIENCRNVIVRDSRFDVGDDAICLKSGKDAEGRRLASPTENVLVENCIVYHGHGGFTIGSEMSSGVRNVRVNNCLFIGTDIGLRFKSTRGRGGVVENIFISNIRMTDIPGAAINFNLYYGIQEPAADAVTQPETPPVTQETPAFRGIHIENVVCRGAGEAIVLQGLPEMPLRDISLRNVSIASKRGVFVTDAEAIHFEDVRVKAEVEPRLQQVRVRNSDLRLEP